MELRLIVNYVFTRRCEAGDIRITPTRNLEGHTNLLFGAIHLLGGERMMPC
jgi:hypothetical protein